MIFCTIGTQAPFDRFVKIIDEVAAHLDEEIIAQVYKVSMWLKTSVP
mgnify:CR=1 FL=1